MYSTVCQRGFTTQVGKERGDLFIQIWKCWTCARPSCISEPMSRYPAHLSPNITPTKSGKAQKSRTRREPSGVFSLFQPQQIQQFKEAFSLIDQDRDGLVGERDLKDTFTSLGAHAKPSYRCLGTVLHSHFPTGIVPSAEMMEELLTSRPGEHGSQPLPTASAEDPRDRGVNFAMFLTMMSEHLFEFDAEAELLEAFASFDESDSGMVRCDEIKKWLGETGDRMSQTEVGVSYCRRARCPRG